MTAARTPTGCREPARPQAPTRRRPAGRRRSASSRTRRARARRRSDRGSRPAARPAGPTRSRARSRRRRSPARPSIRSITLTSRPVPTFHSPALPASAAASERLHDVADVDVVARLEAVAEHRRRLVARDAAGEDRDHAAPRRADPGAARRRCRGAGSRARAVQPVEQAHVLLGAQLGGAVRRLRLGGRGLRRRPHRVLAVDGAAGGGEHDARRRRPARPASTLIVPVTLTAASAAGSATESAHVGLRGEVQHDVGPVLGDSASSAAASRMSTPANGASTRSRLPLERSSIASTSSPRAASASTRCEPMKPAPPVTSARISVRPRRARRRAPAARGGCRRWDARAGRRSP